MNLTLVPATIDDAAAIASLRTAVADHLTRDYGCGHWSSAVSEKSVLNALRTSRVFVARSGTTLVGTLGLATKKPWAIDKSYFTNCRKPLYLRDMATAPDVQRQGIGRRCLEEAKRIVKAWAGDAIRLDAYDAAAGAGGFYQKCGFREMGRVSYRNTPLIYFEFLL